MKARLASACIFFLSVSMLAQQNARPQMKVRIVADKDVYTVNERVMVKSELTNLTSKTLCFPVPDQDCEITGTGWIVTIGVPASYADYGVFTCHADGGGPSRVELESEIKNRWIKLPPNAVYLTKAAEAKASLDQAGDWRLMASYHPPVGAFSPDYVKVLRSAAENVGCKLPDSTAAAEPRI